MHPPEGEGLGIAVVAVVGAAAFACALDMEGLGNTFDEPDGGPEAATTDVTVPRPDSAAAEASPGLFDAAEEASADDAPAEASTADSPAPPPSCPPGVICNGTCTANTDCHACPGATLLCGVTSTCEADCTACAASPIECYACDGNRMNPIGSCARQDPTSYCLDTNYIGAYLDGGQGYHCACNTAADCLSDSQVCIRVGSPTGPFACYTCGEAFTDMFTCKAGTGMAKCNAMKATCN